MFFFQFKRLNFNCSIEHFSFFFRLNTKAEYFSTSTCYCLFLVAIFAGIKYDLRSILDLEQTQFILLLILKKNYLINNIKILFWLFNTWNMKLDLIVREFFKATKNSWASCCVFWINRFVGPIWKNSKLYFNIIKIFLNS